MLHTSVSATAPATPTPAPTAAPTVSADAVTADAGLLDQLLESTGDGVLRWDLVSGQIQYSRRWRMILGYEDHELTDVAELWRFLSHPDDLPRVDQMLREHLADFWPFSHGWRMRHRNGEWRWILWRATSLRDASGIPTLLLALCTDITDQMRAEERQKALVTAVPDLMLRLRIDGLVLDEKEAALAHPLPFAITIGQLLLGDRTGDGWVAQTIETVRLAVASGDVVSRELTAADGGTFLELRAVRSGADEAVCIIRDVTEQRVAARRRGELQAQVEALHLAERARLADELAIAVHIQGALLPKPALLENLEIACQMLPAAEVGGDYFAVRPSTEGAWLAIGDVSGHGLNAGIIMLMVQTTIASLVTEAPCASPAAILRAANRILYENICQRLGRTDFVTLTVLRYRADGRLSFAGAHEEILILRAADGRVDRVPTPGTWLGVLPELGPDVPESEEWLRPGDVMVLFTDGITEARDATGAQFGVDRLIAAVRRVSDSPVDVIRDHVLGEVERFGDGQDDDRSLMVARYLPPR